MNFDYFYNRQSEMYNFMKTALRDIDAHLRTRLRMIIWKKWKVPSKRQWGLQKLGKRPSKVYT